MKRKPHMIVINLKGFETLKALLDWCHHNGVREPKVFRGPDGLYRGSAVVEV